MTPLSEKMILDFGINNELPEETRILLVMYTLIRIL